MARKIKGVMSRIEFIETLRKVYGERFPRCRDCADVGPICPHNGLPCDLKSHFDDLAKVAASRVRRYVRG